MRRNIEDQKPALLVSAYHLLEHLYEILNRIGSEPGYCFHMHVQEFNTFGTVVYTFPE